MDLDTEARRAERQATFLDLAHPQYGVEAMKDAFGSTTPVPGVVDVAEAPPAEGGGVVRDFSGA